MNRRFDSKLQEDYYNMAIDPSITDFKIEHTAKLPPWEVEGALVDIVVDREKKTMCVMISHTGIAKDRSDESTDRLWEFCETVMRRLKDQLPSEWKVI